MQELIKHDDNHWFFQSSSSNRAVPVMEAKPEFLEKFQNKTKEEQQDYLEHVLQSNDITVIKEALK
jgi:hypothetical protein